MGWARAPGKVILVGEHFVVHGAPAIALPLPSHGVRVMATREPGPWSMPDVVAAYLRRVLPLMCETPDQLTLTVESDLPVGAGLGGSAALAVALVRALDDEGALTDEAVRVQAHQLEKVAHGNPSGIDDTVAAHGCPVYYLKGERPVLMTDVRPLGRVADAQLAAATGQEAALWVGVTGARTNTREAIAHVARLAAERADWFQDLFREASGIAIEAEGALRQGDWVALGRAMTANHELLRAVEVSTVELDWLVDSAIEAGAFGAKLTGGGLGGAAIALVPADVDLTSTWQAAGATEVIAP